MPLHAGLEFEPFALFRLLAMVLALPLMDFLVWSNTISNQTGFMNSFRHDT